MAVEIATAYVTILPSARGFGRALSRELDGAGMEAAGGKAGSSAAGAFGKTLVAGVALAAAAAAVGLGALGKAAAGYGLKIASQNEQASISFETLLGSAEAAATMINDLKRFAAETPFEFPELQKAAGSLLTTGVAANKIIPIMRTLGDVTSGMGTGSEGVQRATIALQQMNAAGRITAEDLNQLRDAGIPVFDLLAGATGRSKEELSAMAQNGKLAKKELTQLMEALETGKGLERFTGLMEKQSKSLLGLWSTLKDNLGQGLAEAMTPAIVDIKAQLPGISAEIANGLKVLGPILTRASSQLIETLGRLVPSATPVLEAFGNLFVNVLSAVGDLIEDMLPFFGFLASVLAEQVGGAVTELLPEVRELIKAFGPLAVMATRLVGAFASALAPAISALLKVATPLVAVFATGLSRAFDQLVDMDVGGIFDQLVPVFEAVGAAFIPLAQVFIDFAEDVGSALVDMLPELVVGFTELALSFLPMLPDITRLVSDVLPLMVELFREVAPDMITLAKIAIPLAGEMFRLRLIWGDLLLRAVMPFLPLIFTLANILLPLLEKTLVPVIETITRWVGVLSESRIGVALLIAIIGGIGLAKLAIHFVLATIQGYNLLTVLALVNAAYVGQAAASTAAAEAAATGTALSAMGQLRVAIMAATKASFLFQAAVWLVNAALSPWFLIPVLLIAVAAGLYIAYQEVEPFREAVDALWASFQVGLDWIREVIGLITGGDFGAADQMFSDLAANIVETFTNLGTTIRDKASEWALAALEGLKNFAGMIGDFLINTGVPALLNVGKGLLNALIWWVTDAGPHILLGLARIWLYLERFLWTMLLPWLVRTGWSLLGALVGWIIEAVPAALEALGAFFQAIIPWITDTAWPWLSTEAAKLAEGLWLWVQEAIPPLLAQLGEWLAAAGAWITGTALPWLGNAALALVGAFVSWATDIAPRLLAGLAQLIITFEVWLWGTAVPWLVRAGLTLAGALIGWLADVVPKLWLGLGKLIVAFGIWYYGTAVPWLLNAGLALLGALLHFIQEAPGWIAEGFTWILGHVGEWIATAAVWLAEKAAALATSLWGWLKEAIPDAISLLGVWLSWLGGWINAVAVPAIKEKAAALANGLWEWIKDAAPKALGALGGWLESIGVWIAEEAVPWLISKAASLAVAMLLWAVKLTLEMPMYLANLIIMLTGWIVNAAKWIGEKALELIPAFLGWAIRLPILIPALLAKGLEKILGWIVAAVPWIVEKAVALGTAITKWINDAVIAAPGMLWGFAQSIGVWIIETAVPTIVEKAKELFSALTGWIADVIAAAPAKLAEWGDAILNFIKGLPEKITDAAKGMFTGIANAFIAAVNWIIRVWNDLRLELPEIEIYGKKVGGFALESINVSEIPSITGFAKGGRPPMNQPSIVGELGPEIFWPDAAGTVLPNAALSAPSMAAGLNIGHLEVTGQDRPVDTAFSLRSELHYLSMFAGAT